MFVLSFCLAHENRMSLQGQQNLKSPSLSEAAYLPQEENTFINKLNNVFINMQKSSFVRVRFRGQR